MNACMSSLDKICRFCDKVSLWSGRMVGWLIIPMVLALVWEVFARYSFSKPTAWAYDITFMLYGTHFMIGAAYTLYMKSHVRTEFIYQGLSSRNKGLIDSFFYIVFFFPGILLFFDSGLEYATNSWALQERMVTSPWMPIIYPFKAVMPIALILLLIQGVSELRKSLYAVKHDEPYPEILERAGEGHDI